MIYPTHTPVTAITFFDRSTKVYIECMNHEGSRWYTKDPFVSNWFAQPSNCDVFGNATVNCDCKADQYWTSAEYHDGKGDTVYGAPATNSSPCNCEHVAHFPDDAHGTNQPEIVEAMKLPFIHAYLDVPAGDKRASYVGPICNECARVHMADWLI